MNELLLTALRCAAVVALLMAAMPYLTWFERRVIGRLQVRLGPNRVGPAGLLQPLADGIKLLFKEDVIPARADRQVFLLAPGIALFAALASFAVIPLGPTVTIAGTEVPLVIADLPVGLLYVLGASSLGVYALVLGGWSSGSKYSLLGGLRAAAQVVSYELVLGLALVGVAMTAGSLDLGQIVAAQASSVPFALLQPLGFVLYALAATAEVNRAPFDLPEAETELVAGYHTEYSGLRFAMYFIAEYINMITVSALAATLYLGGWIGPFWPGPWWLALKVILCLFVFVWVRASLPRLRYDQLMRLSWSLLVPISLLNALATAVVVLAVQGK